MISMRAICRNQGTHRAGLETLSAKHAITFFQGTISGGHDLRFRSSVSLAYGIVYLDLIAGLDTPAAENASREIPGNKGINVLKRVWSFFGLKTSGFHPVFYGKCL
jgi:hypothetical protein